MSSNNDLTLDDVLNRFASETQFPSREVLEHWISLYPQYEHDLIKFAANWYIQESLTESQEISKEQENKLLKNAIKYSQNVLSRKEIFVLNDPEPITNLVMEAKKKCISSKGFATACNLDLEILAKLNERLLAFESIPKSLIQKISDILDSSIEAVTSFLSTPPSNLANASFLSKQKPNLDYQEEFISAVKSSSLPQEIKEFWQGEIIDLGDTE